MTFLIDAGMVMYWGTSRWTPFEIFEAYSVVSRNNLNNYFNLCVCLSFCLSLTLSNFQFLLLYDKMSLIKVAWNVLRVKNMHSGSPQTPGDHEEK